MPHRIYNGLDRLAAISRRRRLKAEELQRLDELVKETRAIIATDDSKMLRRLHQRAQLIRKSKCPPARQLRRSPRGGNRKVGAPFSPPASSPSGLDLARHKVLGGLPSSRRGH